MHHSVCLRHFMSCALATHQWATKWAVFLDGLLRILLLETFQCIFFNALHNPWQPRNAEVFSLPSSPSRATRPQFNQFEWHSGVTRGSLLLLYFLFFIRQQQRNKFFLRCCCSVHTAQLEIFLVRHFSQIWRFLTSFWDFVFSVLVDYRGQSMAGCQHKWNSRVRTA